MMRIDIEGRRVLLACVVCFITFFVNNSVITPDIMESRNIVTAREMVYDGHWIVPTINGELRFEKPPLPTWLTAVAEIISPDNLALQRGMSGLAALLLVFYFWHFARKILRMDPLVPTLLLCTCYNVILMGRTASWDIYCHAFMMGGIYHLASALNAPPRAWRHFLLAGLFTGLSILSKGPVSLYALFLPFLISYGYFSRPSLRGKVPALCIALLIAVAVGTWWYAYCYVVQGDSLSAVVQKESGSWINHNVRPWWYYWKFFLETGVWSLFLLTAIFLPLADARRRKSRNWLFSLVWLLASLVLLSLLPEKKSRYLLPVVIPAVLTGAHLFVYWIEQMKVDDRLGRLLYRMNAGLILLVTCALPFLLYRYVYSEMHMGLGAYLFLSLLCIGIGVGVFYAFRKVRPYTFLLGVVGLMMIAELFMMPYIGSFVTNKERKSISLTRDIKALKPLPFYQDSRDTLRIELVYAAYKKILKIDLSDTLQVRRSLPFVLVSKEKAEEVLPEYVLDKVELTPIDRYNDNPWPKGHRRYTEDFINYVTVIREKKDDEQDE